MTIRYNGSATTRIPLGGHYFESYSRNGMDGLLYTTAPYTWRMDLSDYAYFRGYCTSIVFRMQTQYDKPISTSDLNRYWAAPVRCIREE